MSPIDIHNALTGRDLRTGVPVTSDDAQRFGGKATGLARLTAVGATVPTWTAIDVDACTEHLDRAGVASAVEQLAHDGTDRQVLIDEIRRAIVATPLDEGLRQSIAEFIADRGPVAVRSSAVGEDGEDRSFAGIYESYLHRTGDDAVGDAVRRCWASAFTVRALDYRTADDMPATIGQVGVIIQDMADGAVSGVAFTAHPVTGRTDHALISCCWGLAEGVVDGRVDTDEYVLDHTGVEVDAHVADKESQVLRAADGHGTILVPTPAEYRRIRCLTTDQAQQLLSVITRVADELGGPQDIEWTITGDEVILLQTRPITALAGAQIGTWRTVWDNSNVQESFNGVTTPLTFSWAARVYDAIFTDTLRMIGVRRQTIVEHRKVLRNMIGLVDGRIYYNIDNWYRVLRLAPFFDRNKEDVERMIGVENPVDFIEGMNPTTRERLAALPQLAPVAVTLGRRLARRARLVDEFQAEVGAQVQGIRDDLADADDLISLLALGDRGLALFERWSMQIVNDLYLSNQAGRARRLLRAAGHPDPDETVAGLLASEEAVESLLPTLTLMRLATTIRGDAALRAALATGDARTGLDAVRSASPQIAAELDRYIEDFGDRCIGEQKLETISLRQDPTFLGHILRNYVNDDSIDADGFARAHRQRQSEFERGVLGPMPARRRRKLLQVTRKARHAVRDRERMRLTRTRIVGVGRDIYLRIGALLADGGLLDDPRDVFYLSMEELSAFAEGRSVTRDIAALARARRAEFAAYEESEPPNQFTTSGPPSLTHNRTQQSGHAEGAGVSADGATLRGTGCWPGIVEGEIRVILRPDDDLDVRGTILTTVRTDPGWGPLFPSVRGLLIERGSTLSHSAVLARELGIPAVVGVPGLLDAVSDGERVRLDGGSGVVERLDHTAAEQLPNEGEE